MDNFLKKSGLLDIKDRDILFLSMSATAIIFSVCLVIGLNFIDDINYNGKVLNELNSTNNILGRNADAAKRLDGKVEQLNSNEDLQKLQISSENTPLQVIFDSMPASYNTVSLQSSLKENIFNKSGVSVVSLSVASSRLGGLTATSVINGMTPVEWTATLSDDVRGLQDAIKDLERTIRPMIIDGLQWERGSSTSTDQLTVTATTFYAPLINYTLGSKAVPR